MRDIYILETFEQLEAISDPARWRILLYLIAKPLTGIEIARELNIPRPRAYYHLKIMENAGLICFKEERLKNGVIEKCYRSIAATFSTSPLITKTKEFGLESEESKKCLELLLDIVNSMLENAQKDLNHPEIKQAFMQSIPYARQNHFILTEEQSREIRQKFTDVWDYSLKLSQENQNNPNPETKILNLQYTLLETPVQKLVCEKTSRDNNHH